MDMAAPMILIVVVWIFLGSLILSLVKKAKTTEQKKQGSRQAAQKATLSAAQEAKAREVMENLRRKAEPDPFRPVPAQPTVGIGRHDDSLYQGSMNAVTGEGSDPCHEEQMAGMDRMEAEPEGPGGSGGEMARISWNAGNIAQGFVMSEILHRRRL